MAKTPRHPTNLPTPHASLPGPPGPPEPPERPPPPPPLPDPSHPPPPPDPDRPLVGEAKDAARKRPAAPAAP